MSRLTGIALVVALAAPIEAAAQDVSAPSKTYLAIRAGIVSPQSTDLEGFSNGFALEAAAGYRATEGFALEIGVGRFSIGAEATLYDPYYAIWFNRSVKDTAIPITLTAKGILAIQSMEVYALAGGGVALISSTVTDSAAGYGSASATDSANAFIFQIGGGVALAVSPQVSIGAEAKYFIGSVNIWGLAQELNSILVAGTLSYRL